MTPGTPVHFTARTENGAPFTVLEWIWADHGPPPPPDSGSADATPPDSASAKLKLSGAVAPSLSE